MPGCLRRMCLALIVCAGWGGLAEAANAEVVGTRPVEGLRENTPEVHALVGGRIVVSPGRVIEKGTLVIRGGRIAAVGEVETPADARVWDLTGKTITPGLIDALTEVDVDASSVRKGAAHWSDQVTPQLDVVDAGIRDSAANKKLRSQGIAARLLAPSGRILKGGSAVVLTNDQDANTAVVSRNVAQHLRLTVSPGRGRSDYPSSPMGAVALARQTLLDADWYQRAWQASAADASLPQPERNDALAAVAEHVAEQGLFICDASNELFALRADRFAREFSLNIAIRGSGHEYKRLEAIAACNRAVILPVDFPKPPNVATTEAALSVDLDDLLHWEMAPENPGRLVKAGVTIALSSHGLDDAGGFLAGVRRAVKRGLAADAALAAMTTTPAAVLGVADKLGTLETHKLANFIVTDGDLLAAKTRVLETWVAGERFEVEPEVELDLRGRWTVKPEGDRPSLVITLEGKPAALKGTVRPAEAGEEDEPTAKLVRAGVRNRQFSCAFSGKGLIGDGVVRLTAVVIAEEEEDAELEGQLTLGDGQQLAFTATRLDADEQPAEAGDEEEKDEEEKKEKADDAMASQAVTFPLGAAGRTELLKQPAAVHFRNGTIWTSGDKGILENASVLVVEGRIQAVGADVAAPA
ncbi:MAG: amidohydrolase family protein, partial [Planctomycetota bacterium]|nr:amidohydrolase family protein [Planctomycetota bacterium]